jgi:hypothetical protein
VGKVRAKRAKRAKVRAKCFSHNQASKLRGVVKNRLDLQYPTIVLP